MSLNIKSTFVLTVAMAVTSCTTFPMTHTHVDSETIYPTLGYNAFYGDAEFRSYVDSVNTNLYILFSYTRALNRIAVSRGWNPPDYSPLCEFIAWGKLREPPPFAVSDTVVTYEGLSDELASYIKLTRELYKLQVEEFENLEIYARELCTY